MGFTKLFEDIVKSSIWDEDDKTRIVWITLLALKDAHDFVRGTENWLAMAARVSLEECQRALKKLSEPDPSSHRKNNQGRRIMAKPGGWWIINGDYYRFLLSEEQRKEYKREWQRRNREAKRSKKAKEKVGKNNITALAKGNERLYLQAEDRGDEEAMARYSDPGYGKE